MEGYVTIFTSHSYHLSIGIDAAVTAILGIFTTVMGVIPKFKAHGGGPRENLALQNVQVQLNLLCKATLNRGCKLYRYSAIYFEQRL